MPRQSTTYFDFKGGLNTEASPINLPATDSSDTLNMWVNQDGSIEPRKGIDFLGEKEAGGFYETNTFDFSSTYGSYSTPVPSFQEVNFVTSAGILNDYIVSIIGNTIYIYEYASPDDLIEISSPYQTITFSPEDANNMAAFQKTLLIPDQNRVIIINPHIKTGYLQLAPDDTTIEYKRLDLFVRDLKDDTVIDSRVNFDDKSYLCIKSHNQTPEANISTGANWKSYWVPNGAAISGDPAWSSVSTIGSGTWKAKQAVRIFNATINRPDYYIDRILENGYYWKVKSVSTVWTDASGTEQEKTGFTQTSYTGWIEPIWGTPSIGTEVIEKVYDISDEWGGTNQSSYHKIVWEAYASTTDTANSVFNTNVKEVISLNYQSSDDDQAIEKFTAGVMSSGRLWLSGLPKTPNAIYFSQTVSVDDPQKYGRFYQHADPFSDTDTEVVDDDGGTIVVGNARKILALQDFDDGVLVFATNGVWFISGQDTFRPTNFIVDKISDDGIVGRDAFTLVDDKVIYFGKSRVWEIIPKQVADNKPSTEEISKKINGFWNSLNNDYRAAGKATYNQATNKIYFAFTISPSNVQQTRNRNNQSTDMRDALVYDEVLKSWVKFSIEADNTGAKVTIGDINVLSKGRASASTVVDNNDEVVVDESGVTVVAQDISTASQITTVMMYIKKNGDNCDFSFGQFSADDYQDFSSNSTDTEDYESYIDMAHNLYNDVIHKKQFPYVMTIFERVESGVLDGDGVDITPGSCKMRVDWNWSTNTNSNKFGELRQVYFPYKWTNSHFDGVDPGLELVVSKHKIRGRGNTMKLHFEKDGGKGFKLLGWQLLVTSKRRA